MNWRVVFVGLLAVTAGCGGILGDSEQRSTVTPVPVPTQSPTPEDPRVGVAPGLSADGIIDTMFLARNHREAARATSYVWTENETRFHRYDNVSVNTSEYQRVTFESASRYHRYVRLHQTEIDGQLRYVQDYEEYGDGQYEYNTWFGHDPEHTYRRDGEANASREYANLATGPILRYLNVENETVTPIDVGERQYYEVEGTQSVVAGYGNVTNYTARAVIREDGFVRSLEATFEAERAGEVIVVRYNYTYTEIGTATVTEPDWVDEARDVTGDG